MKYSWQNFCHSKLT